jgi:hypothetical protein
MDPGNPEARAYLQNLLLEIDRVVKPDAYLFTGVEYPGKDWGYSDRAVQAFRSTVGGLGPPQPDNEIWSAWRRQQLTDLLRELRQTLRHSRPDVRTSVLITTEGAPPQTWGEYITSERYESRMQDWLGWCRAGVIDEIVLEVHERVGAQDQNLDAWVNFANLNTGDCRPIISLAGYMNFSNAVAQQYATVRSRGLGTVLYHYNDPLRSQSRGFFASLPNIVFRNAPGNPLPGRPLAAEPESRVFARMDNPPPAIVQATPTPLLFVNPLEEKPLVFSSPTPIPSSTPVPVARPEEILRRLTLTSGKRVEATVLEVSPTTITIQQPDSVPVVIARSVVAEIEPPL